MGWVRCLERVEDRGGGVVCAGIPRHHVLHRNLVELRFCQCGCADAAQLLQFGPLSQHPHMSQPDEGHLDDAGATHLSDVGREQGGVEATMADERGASLYCLDPGVIV